MKLAIERRMKTVQLLADSLGVDMSGDRTAALTSLFQAMIDSGRMNPDFRIDDFLLSPFSESIKVDKNKSFGIEHQELQRILQELGINLSANSSIEEKLRAHEAVFVHTALRNLGYNTNSMDNLKRLPKCHTTIQKLHKKWFSGLHFSRLETKGKQ